MNTTLESFRNILVSAPGTTPQAVAVPTPYFINKPTSPSRLAAEQRRPALMQNKAIATAYGNLPTRAKVGKSYPADMRTFLQAALDANAVPDQAAGVSAASLKSFLSDTGVGVDCSGFVSQALNACMAEFDRTERLNTHSSHLRGGAGHNRSVRRHHSAGRSHAGRHDVEDRSHPNHPARRTAGRWLGSVRDG